MLQSQFEKNKMREFENRFEAIRAKFAGLSGKFPPDQEAIEREYVEMLLEYEVETQSREKTDEGARKAAKLIEESHIGRTIVALLSQIDQDILGGQGVIARGVGAQPEAVAVSFLLCWGGAKTPFVRDEDSSSKLYPFEVSVGFVRPCPDDILSLCVMVKTGLGRDSGGINLIRGMDLEALKILIDSKREAIRASRLL